MDIPGYSAIGTEDGITLEVLDIGRVATQSFRAMDNHGSFHSNRLNRRQLLSSAASVSALAPIPTLAQEKRDGSRPASFDGLKPLGSRATPITSDEYQAHIDRAQRPLGQRKPQIDALF